MVTMRPYGTFGRPAPAGDFRQGVRRHYGALILFAVILLLPVRARGAVLTADTEWSGEVSVNEDVLVPEGVTLTIMPGTTVRVTPSESTKTDPEYLSPLTEVTVRGKLIADGGKGSPVAFLPASPGKDPSWAGIIIDGGSAVLRSSTISGAETGVQVVRGSLTLKDSSLSGNRYGVAAHGKESSVALVSTEVRENDYGLLLLNGATFTNKGSTVNGNRKKDRYDASTQPRRPSAPAQRGGRTDAGRIYRDEVILGAAVWQKRVEVRGIVRVPNGSRLVILPGTVVEFTRKDTNKDTIGENGLLVQGSIIAKGTQEEPIIFRSAEKNARMGDWDAINIMNSDRSQNLIEHCRVQDAYRGLHFHFSLVVVTDTVLTNNYRGMQFQESIVSVRRSRFTGNKSALQARDSEIEFTGNTVEGNYTGMNVFRNSIAMSGNVIADNVLEGVRMREGLPVMERNLIDGNRHGIMVLDAAYGNYTGNVVSNNLESGISLRNAAGVEVSGNAVQRNGINGLSIQDTSAVIRGNLVTDNGERGLGVQSFHGVITANNILRNGIYNLGLDGPGDVSAAGNWWGGDDLKRSVFDRDDDASKGSAELLPLRDDPVAFSWPLGGVSRDTVWRGEILVEKYVGVDPGATLDITAPARVLFAKGSGLMVKGRVRARGDREAPVAFLAHAGHGAGGWDEILLDHATGSLFSHCVFRDATWALHSHFTDLVVDESVFEGNQGGLRFTSGPIEVKRSLFRGNDIGIRSFRGNARVTENIITQNRIGIFVREKGGGLAVTRNNIFANTDYNIRLGDFNTENVKAGDNWWGDAAPAKRIFDAANEPGIGSVRYDPYAKEPLPIPLPPGASGKSGPGPAGTPEVR